MIVKKSKLIDIKQNILANNTKDNETALKRPNFMLLCLLVIIFLSLTIAATIPMLVWNNYLVWQTSEPIGRCRHGEKRGVCLANSYCCDGEYAIGQSLCSGSGLCCLGRVKPCNYAIDNETLWSFQSINEITSGVVGRNVSQPIVEQAVVYTVSAVEEQLYYSDVSENISTELSSATGQQWFCVVGQKETYEIFLHECHSYIIVTIKSIEIVLFRLNHLPNNGANLSSNSTPFPAEEEHTVSFGVDTMPDIEIVRNEMPDESQRNYVIETLDFAAHSCKANHYKCVANTVVGELNERFGRMWQCFVGTAGNDIAVNVSFVAGTLLDVKFARQLRVIVYQVFAANQTQKSGVEVTNKSRETVETINNVSVDNKMAENHQRLN